MKTKHLILVVISFCTIQYAMGQKLSNERNENTTASGIESSLDNLINEYVINHQFMGSILVAEKGKIIFTKGYGLSNVEKNIPNTPETKFGIGSIAKQFTAMLVMQLVEKGKLKLDNRITDFISDFPKDIGDKITVEMLLCHTSGLIFPEGIEKYYHVTTKEEYLNEYLKQLSEEGLRFEPGKGYGYSNAGYFILGLIIEKVTGKSYEEVLTEQILKPLGMNQTSLQRKGSTPENTATSYSKLRDNYITWNEEDNSYDPAICGFAYGGMYSTVGDLFRFSKAFSNNQLLSKKYMDMFLQMRNVKTRVPIPHISKELVKEFFGTFGNGFVGEISFIEDPDTKNIDTLFWHDGTHKLFKSNHFHYSGKDQIIIICSNCSFLCEGNEMVLKIHQLLNNKPYDHILIKHSLTQYIEEDVAMHAGIPAALGEFYRFMTDTLNFIIPGVNYFVNISRQVAQEGHPDWAIEILQGGISIYKGFWEAYETLGDIYVMKKNNPMAIQSYTKSLELNPDNENAKKKLEQLGEK